jgi:hypothetical protein
MSVYLTDGWTTDFDSYGGYNFPTDKGVVVAGHSESLWDIQSSNNGSVSPIGICYATDWFININGGGQGFEVNYTNVIDVLPVCSFFVNLSSRDIMNGCQEFWYRSPIAWDTSIYNTSGNNTPQYYLNIYRASDNVLVYASPDPSSDGTPAYKLASDNSTDASGFKRVYLRVNFPLVSDTKYRFEEYVKTLNDIPLNSVKIWTCNSQDIGNDGLTQMYIFKGSIYARALPVEASYGMIITWGIGRAGVENVVYGSDYGSTNQVIYTQSQVGSTASEVKSVTVIFPMRTTTATDIEIELYSRDAGYTQWEHESIDARNATGTVVVKFNITDPGADLNYYYLRIDIDDINGDQTALAYTMYPEDGTNHCIVHARGITNNIEYYNNFAVHFEITENTTETPAPKDDSIDLGFYLLGWSVFAIGFIIALTFILAPVGANIMVAGIVIGSVISYTGAMMQISALQGNTLADFPGWLASGILRVARGVYEGINWLTGGFLDVVVSVLKALVNLGEKLFYYGGLIAEAVWEIIWFLAFLIVMWGVTKLLDIFTDVAELRFGKALKEIEGMGKNISSTGRQYAGYAIRPVKRIVKYSGKKYAERRERNADEEE